MLDKLKALWDRFLSYFKCDYETDPESPTPEHPIVLPPSGTLPEFPELPSFPGLPGSGTLPELPELPELPSFPERPLFPGILPSGTLPEFPELPSFPGLPGSGTLPELPELPELPSFPERPLFPGILPSGTLPEFPELPSFPGLPGSGTLPELPELPELPSFPERPLFPGILPSGTLPERSSRPTPVPVYTPMYKEGKYAGKKIVLDPSYVSKGQKLDAAALSIQDGHRALECALGVEVLSRLALILNKMGLTVVLTHIDCSALATSAEKARIVKVEAPDLLLSLHFSIRSGYQYKEVETFFNESRKESKNFASYIRKAIIGAFPDHRDQGLRYGEKLYLLNAHSVDACALVEYEVVNGSAPENFVTEHYDQIAEALASGICSYLDR